MHWNVCNHTNPNAQTFVSFEAFVGNLHNSGQVDNTHIIVATGRLKRELFKQIVRTEYVRRGGSSKVVVDTLDSFVRKSLRISGLQLRLATPEQQDYLVMQAIKSSDLQYFAYNGSVSSSAISRLITIVRGLRKDGITAQSMLADIRREDGIVDPKRYGDITAIMEQYENLLQRSGVYDYASLISTLVSISTDSLANLTNKERILFVGFHEFTEPEVSFLQWLGTSRHEVTVFCEGSLRNDGAFSHIRDITQRLTSNGWYTHSQIDSEATICSQLADTLFSSTFGTIQGLSSSMHILPFATSRAEVEQITLTCVQLIESGADPSEICVLTRNPEVYSPLLRSAFIAAQIPFNSSDRFVLSESPLYADVHGLLQTLLSGFRSDILLSFASTPLGAELLPMIHDSVQELRDIAGRLRFTGGNSRGGIDAWKRVCDEMESDRGSQVLREMVFLQEKLLVGKHTVADWVDAIHVLLVESGVLNRLVIHVYKNNRSSELYTPGLLADAELFASSASCLKRLLVGVSSCNNLSLEQTRITLKEFVELLDMSARRARYTVREVGDDGVLITTTEQVRGINFRVVFLCGMYEGAFPRSYQPEVFLGKELPETSDKFYDREKTDFILALTNDENAYVTNQKSVYLTFPQFVSSVESMESSFLRELIAKTDVQNRTISPEFLYAESDKPVENTCTGLSGIESVALQSRVEEIFASGLSPSFLDQYAHCGYKTLLTRFAHLTETTNYGIELESRERGLIVHDLLEALLNSIQEQYPATEFEETYFGLMPFRLSRSNSAVYTKKLQDLTTAKFASSKGLSDVRELHAKSVGDGVAPGILTRIYTQILEHLVDSEWHVLATEFDLAKANNNQPVEVFGGFLVKGVVDRVDVRRSDEGLELRVVDYKTGRIDNLSTKSYLDGRRFQMTLYAAALETLFRLTHDVSATVVSALYVSGSRSVKAEKRTLDVFASKQGSQRETLMEATEMHLRQYHTDMLNGEFRLAKTTTYCSSCDFKSICRVYDRNTIQV